MIKHNRASAPRPCGSVPLALSLLAALALAGCAIPYHRSEAPACNRYIGMPMIGGCFGTTIVTDIRVSPERDCLDVQANNCNGGTLEINNRCGVPLTFGKVTFPPADGLDAIRAPAGHWVAANNPSNFTCEVVSENAVVRLDGMLGAEPLTLTFTKTAPLCDRQTPASHGRPDEPFCRITPAAP